MHSFPKALGLAAGLVLAAAGTAQASPGAVYTQTNNPSGNAVQAYDRGFDGSLTFAGSVPTGGLGATTGLGSQGAVVLSDDGRFVLAVDAGSDDVAAFRVTPRGLRLAGRAPSGGERPISVTVHDDDVYVLNAGGVPNVSGLALDEHGSLRLRRNAGQPLPPGAAGPAEVAFAPDGDSLAVTEKGTNRIDIFPLLGRRDRPGAPVVTASAGATPFGFAFSRRGDLIVSEAGLSTVSSYRPGRFGTLQVVTASALTHQGAACWIAITGDARFAYSANASTGSISGFALDRAGALHLLDADGRTGVAPGPNDLALADGSRYLYAVNPGAQAITAYRVLGDGHLLTLPGASGLPAGVAGLAAS